MNFTYSSRSKVREKRLDLVTEQGSSGQGRKKQQVLTVTEKENISEIS